MEEHLQLQLIGNPTYALWFQSLPDYVVFEIQNSGFYLHHLIGKYNGYLDSEMTVKGLWLFVGLEGEQLPNILNLYQSIINKLNENNTN